MLPVRSSSTSRQQGDTLPAVAAHFHSSEREILAANPDLPAGVTTLPAGYPLRVPAYYLPLTGSPFHILPDSEVVNGPGAVGFDTQAEITSHAGFLAGMSDYANDHQRPAWEVVDIVAAEYSIHPRLLLTLLEAGTGALSRPDPLSADDLTYPLGYHTERYRGLYRQLLWAGEMLNNGYYGWRAGTLTELELADGRLVRPDPWLNAGTAALHVLLAVRFGQADFDLQTSPDGFLRTYRSLWGDPFSQEIEFIPGNLQQAELALPFLPDRAVGLHRRAARDVGNGAATWSARLCSAGGGRRMRVFRGMDRRAGRRHRHAERRGHRGARPGRRR